MKKEREEAFLFSTFTEFNKCWRSGAKARVIMESFNGAAFVNFSAYLGHPEDVHYNSSPAEQKPSKRTRKKSAKKSKRDNERAAQFQKKKKEEAATALASNPVDKPTALMSGNLEFSFASPSREDLRNLSTSSRADNQGELENLRTNNEKEDSMVDIQGASTNPDEEDDFSSNISVPEEETSNSYYYEDIKMNSEEDEQGPSVHEDTDKKKSDNTKDETEECEEETKRDKELANQFRSSIDKDTDEVEDTEDECDDCSNVGSHSIDTLWYLTTHDDPRIVRYFVHRTGLSRHFLQSFKMSHKGHGLSSHIMGGDLECFTKHEKELIDKAYDYFEDLLSQDARGECNIQLVLGHNPTGLGIKSGDRDLFKGINALATGDSYRRRTATLGTSRISMSNSSKDICMQSAIF